MNSMHLQFLASPGWRSMLETDLLPWVRDVVDLGDDVLEIGPGPGLTTDLLRTLAPAVTAIELDPTLAAALAERLSGTNVAVVQADATASGLPNGRFSAVTCFSMLHHIEEPALQDRLFAEACRVLRPSGTFLGVDSVDAEAIRMFHEGDVFVPVDPATLPARLQAAGFSDVSVDSAEYQIRFVATKR
jgi:SAM-dependent methyltransferase